MHETKTRCRYIERKRCGCAIDFYTQSYTALIHAQVSKLANFDRPSQGDKKCGLSVVSAMIHPSLFATGGYDHRVHLWTVPTDVSRTSSQQLAVKHRSLVQALLPIRDTSHKLITAGADCLVNIWDIPSERVANTFNTSNSPHQLHDTSLPFCVLLEVGGTGLLAEAP